MDGKCCGERFNDVAKLYYGRNVPSSKRQASAYIVVAPFRGNPLGS